MAKPGTSDNFVTTATAIIALLLMIIFSGIWFYWQDSHKDKIGLSYALVGPLTVRTDNFSVVAKMAVQTRLEDAEWAKTNQTAIRSLISAALSNIKPEQVNAPGGLAAMQEALKESVSQTLKTDKIEQILLTDFLLQNGV